MVIHNSEGTPSKCTTKLLDKELGRKRSWFDCRHSSGIYLEGMRNFVDAALPEGECGPCPVF